MKTQKATLLVILLIIVLSFYCCAGKGDKKEDEAYQIGAGTESPEQMYQEGLKPMDKKKWDKALGHFETIKNQYPFNPLAVDAELKIADIHYKKKDYLLAAEAYKEFAKMHPTHPDLPYVYFQLGMAYQKETPRFYDRDLSTCDQALTSFGYLQTYFPESTYAQENTEQFEVCRIKLANREFYVGRFYYRQKFYDSAIPRFNIVINDYPDLPIAEKAYFYKARSYFKSERDGEGIETLKKMLFTYPVGEYSEKGRKLYKKQAKEFKKSMEEENES